MKAVQINKYGGSEVLEVNNEVFEPDVNPGQVLVEVEAAGINIFDYTVMSGLMEKRMPLKFPTTMGGDFSGIVKRIADDVTEFKAGDEVYGTAIVFTGGSGSFAELLTANTKSIALKPKNIDFVAAASLPLVGSSAIQAIIETIKLFKGQKILIHGAAGGIGSIAVQIAKSLGAYVAATASEKDKQFVKDLGADEIIDYKKQVFEKILKDYDAVYDTIGGETTDKSFLVLKKGLPAGRHGGILASMKGPPNPELAKKYGVTAVAVNTQTNSEHLKKLTQLVESEIVKPQVDKVFHLELTKDAFIYKSTSHPKGKVVIKIKP